MAKVGFTAHPMQNSIRKMVGNLVLFCGGLVMSKIRILDSRWIGDFNLEGILVWWEIQITDMASTTIMATTWGSMDTLLVSFFVSHTIKYSLWHYPGALPLFSTGSCRAEWWSFWHDQYVIWISPKPELLRDWNSPSRGHPNSSIYSSRGHHTIKLRCQSCSW